MDKEALIKILNDSEQLAKDYKIEIKSIGICMTYDEFKLLKEQGFNIHWIGEEYKADGNDCEELFFITIEE